MARLSIAAFLVLFMAPFTPGQDSPQRGQVKSVNAEKGTITIVADGKEHEFTVTPRTRFMDDGGQVVEKGIKDERLKEGASVTFHGVERDGRAVLNGLLIRGAEQPKQGQGGEIRRAKLKKLDLEKMTVTLTADGKDHDFGLSEDTQVLGASGKDLKERMKEIKEGSDIFFQAGTKDGKPVIRAVKLADGEPSARPPANVPKVDTSEFKSLAELGDGKYKEFKGGLYPDGKNERPAAHEAAGLEFAKSVRPLDAQGRPSNDGKIVLLSVGMSNATQEFSAFKRIADAKDSDKNPNLVIVDGAQGGMTAFVVRNPNEGRGSQYWSTVDERLGAAHVTREQVQVAWIKEADAGPSQGFPKYAQTLQQELGDIARVLHERFPNMKLAYLSCRTYGGYARTPLNPEPYAYESGFSIKWLVEQQIRGEPALNFDPSKGEVKAPWLSWGPYLWANGTKPNRDGLSYEEADFGGDGTHPSQSGQRKVAELMFKFFKTDSTTRSWFVASPVKQAADQSAARPSERVAAEPYNPRQEPLFRLLDRNGDGRLSRDEIEKAVNVLQVLDRDDDGLLDREELAQATRRGGRPGEIITQAARGERIKDSLEAGDEAPDFTLPDPAGKTEIKLSSFRGKRPVVLVFTSFT